MASIFLLLISEISVTTEITDISGVVNRNHEPKPVSAIGDRSQMPPRPPLVHFP
jgi:hypothetical protein